MPFATYETECDFIPLENVILCLEDHSILERIFTSNYYEINALTNLQINFHCCSIYLCVPRASPILPEASFWFCHHLAAHVPHRLEWEAMGKKCGELCKTFTLSSKQGDHVQLGRLGLQWCWETEEGKDAQRSKRWRTAPALEIRVTDPEPLDTRTKLEIIINVFSMLYQMVGDRKMKNLRRHQIDTELSHVRIWCA